MGRLNYAYKINLLTASVRDDGSSVLTKKYASFPSVGLGWVISKEKFMENSRVFNSLKLRGTYGETGNQGIPAYSSIRQINTSGTSYYFDSQTHPSARRSELPWSTSLKWETTLQTDIGLDATMLDNRLTIAIDAYKKKITNLLYFYQTPGYLGAETTKRISAASRTAVSNSRSRGLPSSL